VIGSNAFNLMFILGVSGLIYPLVVQKSSIRYEVPLSMIAAIILWLLANDARVQGAEENRIGPLDSLILLAGLVFFLYYIRRTMRNVNTETDDHIIVHSVGISSGMVLLGIALLVGGGYLVTENAVSIATTLGLSEKLIGLTILAIGTSLPELSTSVIAAYRHNTDIAIGNVVGSNIFNIFFVIGVSGLIRPIGFPVILNEDLFVLLGATALLLVFMFTLSRNKLDRWEAAIFLIGYLTYTVYLIQRN
jgi:cation:H+ antiporter